MVPLAAGVIVEHDKKKQLCVGVVDKPTKNSPRPKGREELILCPAKGEEETPTVKTTILYASGQEVEGVRLLACHAAHYRVTVGDNDHSHPCRERELHMNFRPSS